MSSRVWGAIHALLAITMAGTATAGSAQQVPIGPRAIAMGGAYTSLAEDASATFWNPAGLARLGHQELAFTHADLFKTGIRDNFTALAVPFAANRTAAISWYHSGYDDGELDFGENQVDLAVGFLTSEWLQLGATGKLVTRGTGLDGASVRQGQGLGLDLGVLAVPVERLRVGLMVQDLFDTPVRDADGESDVVYPRAVRAGASYAWGRRGTAAFDLDDRWHLGLEVTPLEAVALRLGAQDDLRGSERPTWSYGLGLRTGPVRLDWARVEHPVLESTDHLAVALEFNLNPAQVRLEKVEAEPIYASLYHSYAREPFGSVRVRNLQDRPLPARLGVRIDGLMDAPSEQELLLRPKAVQEVPLTAVLSERALAQRGDRPVQVQITASYPSRQLMRREKASARTVAYAPGAIRWGRGVEQIAAFVTPLDPAVEALAREATRVAGQRPQESLGGRNLAFAAALVDALEQLGVVYVPDPNNPYDAISRSAEAVDSIHYPFQTLETRTGDCDDTTVLLAALCANVGIATRVVDAPGHVFLLVATGLHESQRLALGLDDAMSVVADEEVWIPIETTRMGQGFAEAWRQGAQAWASWQTRGQLRLVDVAAAQTRYEPAMPPGERRAIALDEARLDSLLARDGATLSGWRVAWGRERLGDPGRNLEPSADALLEIARVFLEGGDANRARAQLERALGRVPNSARARNNLGVVLATQDSLAAAAEQFRAAIALGPAEPGPWLNLGQVCWVLGDSAAADEALARGIALTGGREQALRRLRLDRPDAEGGKGSQGSAMLRGAIERVPAEAVARAGKEATTSDRAPRRILGVRVPSPTTPAPNEWHSHLEWIE